MKSFSKFIDVIKFLKQLQTQMATTNPLFKTLVNENYSVEQRLLFVPYMLFFSCGCPDVMTNIMRVNKKEEDLSYIEKKINHFIIEDNFHYNYYLRDLAHLGYSLADFGSLQAVIRHVFAMESTAVRKLIYNLAYYLKVSSHPIITLSVVETLEAGLYDLFSITYGNIVKKTPYLTNRLEYYGDTHVLLEQKHSVTSWFGMNEGVVNQVSNLPIPYHTSTLIKNMLTELMSCFDDMYLAFDKIIKDNVKINPEKYAINGAPPIDEITPNWQAKKSAQLSSNKKEKTQHAFISNDLL